MLSIVGNRIYLHEGDNCAFRAVYKKNGYIHNFRSSDKLTLIIRDIYKKKSQDIVKVAENLECSEELVPYFIFDKGDISEGDYSYSLILESEGFTYTLIDRAPMSILENCNSTVLSLNEDTSVYVSDSVLVCYFDHRILDDSSSEGGTPGGGSSGSNSGSASGGNGGSSSDDDDDLILF